MSESKDGKKEEACKLKPGSRVAGFLQGACSVNERPGAFAEYVICAWDLVWEIPGNLTFGEAAGISLCGLTAAQAVYYRLGLAALFGSIEGLGLRNRDAQADEEGKETNFFIYSASTSVGMYAAQLVRRGAEASGRRIKLFGTASGKRFQLLRDEPCKYDRLVDYHDADWVQQIRDISDGHGMHYALDCISEGDSVRLVAETLSKDGRLGIVRSREGGAWEADDLPVEPIYGAVWEGLGAEVQYQGLTVPASPEGRRFATEFYRWLSEGGKLEPNPVRKMPGGLERVVEDGFAALGTGSMQDREQRRGEPWMKPVAAEKLIYNLIE
ncbi:hypothetical protein LTS18_008133 [Coniosporium uncinatum]|uniref:Uncharacterized protein n=1 Tax=Coniosporium uncinatum TaxID=93489 RepID=A0ACC3DNN6_9PEZI|nr:hypothetical protein LTS18_008133 [Coniosporium uncinatum]